MRITPESIAEVEAERLVRHEADFDACAEQLARWEVDVEPVVAEVQRFSVAAPVVGGRHRGHTVRSLPRRR